MPVINLLGPTKKRRTDSNWSVIIAFSLLLIIAFIGIGGYMVIEKLTFTEAVYMTIITIATVGFKEVEPLSELGMWFTSFLIVISFGIVCLCSNFFRPLYNRRGSEKLLQGQENEQEN